MYVLCIQCCLGFLPLSCNRKTLPNSNICRLEEVGIHFILFHESASLIVFERKTPLKFTSRDDWPIFQLRKPHLLDFHSFEHSWLEHLLWFNKISILTLRIIWGMFGSWKNHDWRFWDFGGLGFWVSEIMMKKNGYWALYSEVKRDWKPLYC